MGEGGALLSRWRIFVNGVEHTDDIVPTVEGGVRRRGVIEASGTDIITLTYNIEDFSPGVAADSRQSSGRSRTGTSRGHSPMSLSSDW